MKKLGLLFLGGAAALAAGLHLSPSRSTRPMTAVSARATASSPIARPAPAQRQDEAPAGAAATKRHAPLVRPAIVGPDSDVETAAESCKPSIEKVRDHMEDTARSDVKREGDKWAE